MICWECGAALTDEEQRYYDERCEACERDWHDRITTWRQGASDEELDEMFSARSTLN